MNWFRVEMNEAGQVASCREVDAAGTEARVYYFRARSAKQAAQQALSAHAAALLAARRRRYAAEGRCQCGGKRDRPGLITCQRCSDRQKLHKQREQAKARGEEVAPIDRRTVLLERKDNEASTIRLAVFEEVQAAWLSNRTVGAFSAWLNGEVEKLAGKRVA